MVRLSQELISRILTLYKDGNSINKISQKLALQKTTIYYYTRRKFGRHYKAPYFNSRLECELGEFLGAFAGDGNLYHAHNRGYQIRFFLGPNEGAYAAKLSKIIYRLFNKKPSIWYDKSHNLFRITVFGKSIYEIISANLSFGKNKTLTIGLKRKISEHDNGFLGRFAGALISTDGGVSDRAISFYSTSKKLYAQYCDILKKFKVPYRIYVDRRNNSSKKYSTCYQVHVPRSRFHLFNKNIIVSEENKATKIRAAIHAKAYNKSIY